jgi:hypothetical protein
MKTVYSCSFDVAARGRADAVASFDLALQLIRDWVEGKYAASPTSYGFGTPIKLPQSGTLIPLKDHRLVIEDTTHASTRIFTLTWDHPGKPDEIWSSVAQLVTDGATVNFSLHTRLGSRVFLIRPTGYQVGTPRIVRQLLANMDCSLSGWKLPTEAYPVSLGQVDSFVNEVLLHPKRTLPVVVVSVDPYTDKPVVDPAKWASTLAGVAEVAVMVNKWVSFRLTDILGKPLSCYSGAVRIYWPGLTMDAPPSAHRLWLPDTLKYRAETEPVERGLFGLLCAIAVTQHVESPILTAARAAVEASRDAQRVQAMSDVQSHLVEKAELEKWINEAWAEIAALKQKLGFAQQELESTRNDLSAALREADQLRENIAYIGAAGSRAARSGDVAPAPEQEPTDFASVLEAYDAAVAKFGGSDSALVFLDSARESAADSPYKHPEQVYAVLSELNKIARRWRDNNGSLGQRWEDALAPTGFAYAPKISQTAAGKFRSEYEFFYDGEKRLFEEHITKGAKNKNSCFSVHMYRDERRLKLVIGHCGNHLSNTTT